MNASSLQLTIHEQVEVAPSAYFQGYRSSVQIVASNRYGQNNRERYDAVEVTIPSDAGGPIATSRDLIRPSPDSALATVLGILTIRHGALETCLLYVMFFRATVRSRSQKWFTDRIVSRFDHVFYGTPNPQWVALYPLATLRAPALKFSDSGNPNCFVLYSARYMSRGLWEALPTYQERMQRSVNLPPRTDNATVGLGSDEESDIE